MSQPSSLLLFVPSLPSPPPPECPGRGTARCHLSPPLALAVQLPIWGGSVGRRVWTPCFGSTRSVRSVAGVPSYCTVLVYLVPVQIHAFESSRLARLRF